MHRQAHEPLPTPPTMQRAQCQAGDSRPRQCTVILTIRLPSPRTVAWAGTCPDIHLPAVPHTHNLVPTSKPDQCDEKARGTFWKSYGCRIGMRRSPLSDHIRSDTEQVPAPCQAPHHGGRAIRGVCRAVKITPPTCQQTARQSVLKRMSNTCFPCRRIMHRVGAALGRALHTPEGERRNEQMATPDPSVCKDKDYHPRPSTGSAHDTARVRGSRVCTSCEAPVGGGVASPQATNVGCSTPQQRCTAVSTSPDLEPFPAIRVRGIWPPCLPPNSAN